MTYASVTGAQFGGAILHSSDLPISHIGPLKSTRIPKSLLIPLSQVSNHQLTILEI